MRFLLSFFVFISLPAIAAGRDVPATELQRPNHDQTIYVLSGDPSLLAEFHESVGLDWDGGIMLEADREKGAYRYWAYGWRTAPQSRAFIMPATLAGLKLEFEEYNDAKQFPVLRAKLDHVSVDCGVSIDPFFILPTGKVTVAAELEDEHEGTACLLRKIDEEELLEGVELGFLGNELVPETEGR